jgi:cystathionine beta-lyase/cystathionine gamma-synthase
MLNYTLDFNNKSYTRNLNCKYITTIDILSKYYNNNIVLLNSGLQANMIIIYIIILCNRHNKINIIYYDDLYYETILMFKYLSEEYNINIYQLFNFQIDIYETLKDEINILFIESCSNPYGIIFNFDIIKSIKQICNKIYVICDNTWLTHNIFNPLNYDIDVLTTSLSKYYSINKLICGCCIFNNITLYNSLKRYVNFTGIHISLYTLKILNKTLLDVDARIISLSNMTQKIITYLISKNIIVYHPCINTHPSYNLSKYFNDLYPSTFLIGFNKKLSNLKLILKNLNILKLEISFGSYNTKIDPLVFYKDNISYLRLSLGYYDSYDIITQGLDELINIINDDKLYKLTL